ncbi:hypothetical protein [Streptomyces sp. NPDC047070]|uniref:hypothetical protein n=1 Tax=Streptomyces sp. NPDC047070 TaxID=3154923 RepID=UPI0034515D56
MTRTGAACPDGRTSSSPTSTLWGKRLVGDGLSALGPESGQGSVGPGRTGVAPDRLVHPGPDARPGPYVG